VVHVIKRMLAALSALAVITVPTVTPTAVDVDCSGFVVDPRGLIGTAGHCVEIDPAVKNHFGGARCRRCPTRANSTLPIPTCWAETAATEQWQVQGRSPETEIAFKVEVIQPQNPNSPIERWSTAQILDFQRFDDGDNALLKLAGYPPLKPIVISEEPPEVGDAVTVVGFPAT
jgi:serine protease Do